MLHFRPRPTLLALGLLFFSAAPHADNLQEIYELALQNDPVVKAAEATYRAGREAEILGRSRLLPQVGAQAEVGRNDMTQVSKRVFPIQNQNIQSNSNYDVDEDEENYYLTVSQKLFDLPAWFGFKQGKALTRQAEAQFAADQQDLIMRTVEAYMRVLRAIDNLKSSRTEEAAYQRQLEQAQQRFEVGLIAITDVHEARAAFDLAVVERLTDEGNLGVAYEALSVLTGQDHANLWLLSEEFPVVDPQPATAESWVELAMEGNLGLKVANYAAEAAMQSSQASRAQHLPKLSGQLTLMDTSTDGDNFDNQLRDPEGNRINPRYPTSVDVEGNSVMLTLSMPLYAGGGISSQRRQSYENYITARETHTSIMRDTIQFTRSLHLFVTTDVQRVKARRQAIVSAQSALDATTAGYEVGTRNVVDVLNAQQVLFTAIRDYANTRYDYVSRLLRLRQQAGLLSPEDVVALNKWLVEPTPATATAPRI